MARTNQSGSVLSFVVIGVVLVALVLGGAYLVHQHATGSLNPPSSQQPASEPQNQSSDNQKASDTTNNKQPSSQTQSNQESSSQTTPQSSQSTAELPQTGPSQNIATLLAVCLLSIAAVSYARSRRPELSL